MAKKKEQPKLASPMDDDKYRAEDALRTLTRAEEHKLDKDLMKKVHELAGKQLEAAHKTVKSVQDLKDIRNEKFGPKKGK